MYVFEDLPPIMAFDELINHPAYRNCGDNGLQGEYLRWFVLLNDGTFYKGSSLDEPGRKCGRLEKLDPVMFHH